ncbi:hypothetical protein FOA52_008206 [Chlamydomonas sp. UWO 241]|nr:hypothetical protein FOA52_008206 [Chlamydomonas sp. UWO 241]
MRGGEGGAGVPGPPVPKSTAAAAATAEARLQASRARQAESTRQLAEAQAAGAASLVELHRQGEVLQQSTQTLGDVNAQLDTAEDNLASMGGGLTAWARWLGLK